MPDLEKRKERTQDQLEVTYLTRAIDHHLPGRGGRQVYEEAGVDKCKERGVEGTEYCA